MQYGWEKDLFFMKTFIGDFEIMGDFESMGNFEVMGVFELWVTLKTHP